MLLEMVLQDLKLVLQAVKTIYISECRRHGCLVPPQKQEGVKDAPRNRSSNLNSSTLPNITVQVDPSIDDTARYVNPLKVT